MPRVMRRFAQEPPNPEPQTAERPRKGGRDPHTENLDVSACNQTIPHLTEPDQALFCAPVNACPHSDRGASAATEEIAPLPRKREIEAAFAAYNRIDRATAMLPPSALRLLTVMFPRSDACRRSVASLAQEGFDVRTLRRLLRALLEAGFLSKESLARVTNSYRLHLPPRRRR
jgi:hypothetical protein